MSKFGPAGQIKPKGIALMKLTFVFWNKTDNEITRFVTMKLITYFQEIFALIKLTLSQSNETNYSYVCYTKLIDCRTNGT